MNRYRRFAATLAAVTFAAAAASFAEEIEIRPPLLLGGLAVNATHVVFSHAGDLYSVPRSGGAAARLTSGPAEDFSPVFSADGSLLAFARALGGGNIDIFTMAPSGGAATRLTFHPKLDVPRSFSPDGKTLVFLSGRDGDGVATLYTIDVRPGAFEKRIPVPSGYDAALSPDGKRLAYSPWSIPYEDLEFRHYRGGAASPLRILDLGSGRVVQEIPRKDENLRVPQWAGGTIYHLSDATGAFALHAYDVAAGTSRVLVKPPRGEGIRAMAFGGGAIAYEIDGTIRLLDPATLADAPLPFTLRVDAAELAPREAPIGGTLETVALAPGAGEIVVGARGDVLTIDVETGAARNRTETPGADEREPVLSPDGNSIAYFSDASGEETLEIAPAIGRGPARRIAIEERPAHHSGLVFSPDSARIAFSGSRLDLFLVDVRTGKSARIDRSDYVAQGSYRPRFSPDGAFLAYAKADERGIRSIFVHDVSAGTTRRVTDGRTHCESPVFDRGGRYLYFIASNNARLAAASDVGWGLLSTELALPLVTKRLCLAVLRPGDRAPFHALSGERDPLAPPADALGAEAAAGPVDWEGIERRIVPFPLPERAYMELEAAEPGSFLVRTMEWPATPGARGERPTPLHRVRLEKPRELLEEVKDVDWFAVEDGDGASLLFGARGEIRLRAGDEEEKKIPLVAVRFAVDPRAEWSAMYRAAWRQMRDYFYDPGHHGQDLAALAARFEKFLPNVTRRRDLNRLFERMLGHVSVSHLRVGGGDESGSPAAPQPNERIGLLGADYAVENGRYRITRILRNGPFLSTNRLLRAPLDQPGVAPLVREGDYLLAIDGKPLDAATTNVHAAMAGTAGRPTEITVGASPDGADGKAVTLTVIPTPGENALRLANDAAARAKRVDELSKGRLGYVFVPDFGPAIEDFTREVLARAGKDGLVIDQRWNGGGITPDTLVEWLRREEWYAYRYRNGGDVVVPPNVARGPKVLITNESDASAAETFALMFRLTGAGEIVGRPTMGAGIGAALEQPRLLDGGSIRIPNRAAFNPAGSWDIENRGVEPHHVVEWTPEDFARGTDTQLDRAVAVALEALAKAKPRERVRPAFPVHD